MGRATSEQNHKVLIVLNNLQIDTVENRIFFFYIENVFLNIFNQFKIRQQLKLILQVILGKSIDFYSL